MAAERPGELTISAVSRLLGIPVPTIRSWERRYGFPRPARTAGRHRRYTLTHVQQLRTLRDEIARGRPPRQAVAWLRRRGLERAGGDQALVASATDQAMRLDSTALRHVLDRAAQELGPDEAIRRVGLPLMRALGDRWRAGRCDTAHEHLATEAVRGWLARLEALAPRPSGNRTVVLACGPKEVHSIGLEAFAVLLARRGWACRVLGQNTPAQSLAAAVEATTASAVVVTAYRSVARRSAIQALRAVRGLSSHLFYAGGAFAVPQVRRGVPGTYLGEDLLEAVEILERAVEAA